MIRLAPLGFALAVAHNPIGPCAMITTVADPYAAVFSSAESRSHDVRTHQHLFVAETIRNNFKVGHRIRHEQIFSLGSINRIAKAPAAGSLATAL